MRMKTFLLGYGILAMLIFLYSGYTLQQGFPHLYANDISIRYLYRANHIYLLFSALLILLYASTYNRSSKTYINRFNFTSAILLVVAHNFLIVAFFTEPPMSTEIRPLSYYGVMLSLIAVMGSVFFRLTQKHSDMNKPE